MQTVGGESLGFDLLGTNQSGLLASQESGVIGFVPGFRLL